MLFNGYLLHFYNIYIRIQKHCRTRRAWAVCDSFKMDAQDRILTFILNKRQENCGESKKRGTIYNL